MFQDRKFIQRSLVNLINVYKVIIKRNIIARRSSFDRCSAINCCV